MRRQRPAGSIYNASISKQKRTPLEPKDMNTQRTITRDRKSSVASTYTHKWAYDYDNVESSKNSKQTTKSYNFQSFNNSNCSKAQNATEARFDSFKQIYNLSKESINIQDSLAQYQKLDDIKENAIVRKLTCLNNIFKELKELRNMDLSQKVQNGLSNVEDKLLAIQREVIKRQNSHRN